MSAPADRVLRPGDKIEWTPAGVHKLRLGGSDLTSFADVGKIMTISPAPTTVSGDVHDWKPGETVTATLKDDADKQGVTEFKFTCGQHPGGMRSSPFTIEAKPSGANTRTFAIRSDDPQKWILRKPDGSGDVQIDDSP
jgi:plastocyanin